jgi:hypothetical protein
MSLLGYSRCNRNFKEKFGQKPSNIKIRFDIKNIIANHDKDDGCNLNTMRTTLKICST